MHIGKHYFFEHENQLGDGAFGTVYEGIDTRNESVVKQVAIKEISRKKLNVTNLEREQNITQFLISVKDPNIVAHYDVISTDKFIYFVMELCNYGDLDKYYTNISPLPEGDITIIAKQLADGLQVLYSKNIIHRDMKPSNILLHNAQNKENPTMKDLTLKIADFSLSRFISNNRLATTAGIGTLSYMAPELYVLGSVYDYRADTWAVGLILYEGLLGQVPVFIKTRSGDQSLNKDVVKMWLFLYYQKYWQDLREQNKEFDIIFLPNISENLQILLRKLLKINPTNRMTVPDFIEAASLLDIPTINEEHLNNDIDVGTNVQDSQNSPKLNLLKFPNRNPILFDLNHFKEDTHKHFGSKFIHDKYGKFVRIKNIPFDNNQSKPENVKNILKELNILQEASNTHQILEVYGLCLNESTISICFELMDMDLNILTKNFHTQVAYLDKINEDVFGALVVSLVDGLSVLHESGLLNLGITSKNIFLNVTGEVKLGHTMENRFVKNAPSYMYEQRRNWRQELNKLAWALTDICNMVIALVEFISGIEQQYNSVVPKELTTLILEQANITANYSDRICKFLDNSLSPDDNKLTYTDLKESNLYKYYKSRTTKRIIAAFVQKYEDTYNDANTNDTLASSSNRSNTIHTLSFPNDKKLYEFKLENFDRHEEIDGTNYYTVRKYIHKLTGNFVAIKRMKLPQTRHITIARQILTLLAKFMKQEIETHRSFLSDPYIVGFYGFTISNNEILICMELMNANLNDLSEFIHEFYSKDKEETPVFPEKLLGITGISILNGLIVCNEKGIMHRDIKPLNVFLNIKGEIKLGDFGRSTFLDEDFKASTVNAGTKAYLPPERMESDAEPNAEIKYDIRSDTWSLGLTLAELARGDYPIVDKHGKKPNTEFAINKAVREAQKQEICARCLGDRYSSNVKEFIAQCLEELDKRPKFDQLTQTEFYETFNKSKEEANAYVAKFVQNMIERC